MIELYVLITLLGVGYILNQKRPVQMKVGTNQLNNHERPSANTIYDSNYVEFARAQEAARARAMHAKAMQNPQQVVPKAPFSQTTPEDKKPIFSQLAGVDFPVEQFEHNNMMPFFKGSLKQDTRENSAHQTRLEAFTGMSDLYFKKQEQEPLFVREKNVGNLYGTQNNSDFFQSRLPNLSLRNNELPIEQQRVGPGISQGFTVDPTGGFQQMEIQEAVRPKTVDELRVLNKPKVTYDGRTVDGIKEKMRGDMGIVFKNRNTSTVAERTCPDDFLRTTGAVLKERNKPVIEVKATNRKDTSDKTYEGPAYQNREMKQKAAVRAPHKNQLSAYDVGVPGLHYMGVGDKADHGKVSIQVYNNERDITTTRTYQGNLTSVVKSIVAPIEDLFRITKRIYTSENARENAELQPQFPSKLTIYDPNDIARTTLKETLLHSSDHPVLETIEKRGQVYDPEEYRPKPTVRETLSPEDTSLNLASRRRTGKAYDPDDFAKTTVKETSLWDATDAGRLAMPDRLRGGYTETNHDPRLTQKQFLSQVEHVGQAEQERANGGYKVANAEAKDTHKQFLSDHEYFGHAETATAKEAMSYDDIYNATMNELRELTLVQREPTKTGVKVASGIDNVEVSMPRKPMCDPVSTRVTLNQVPVAGGQAGVDREAVEDGVTRAKQAYCDLDRLDASILKPLVDNPFALRLA